MGSKYMSQLACDHSTPVTCPRRVAHGYLTHLPQNLGDGGWIWSRGSPYPTLHHFPASLSLPAAQVHLQSEEPMNRFLTVLFSALFLFTSVSFAESAAGRAESAATVLNEIMSAPDKGIPEEIL